MEIKKKHILFENEENKGLVKNILSKLSDIKDNAKSEIKETAALVRLIKHAVKSYSKNREFDLDKKDIEFIKGQSGDLIKSIVLLTVSITPIPIPLTPFLVILGKKIGIDLLPKKQEIPDKVKKENLDENYKKIFNDEKFNLIEKLCYQSKVRKLKSTIFCELLNVYNETPAKEKLLASVQNIYDFFVDGLKGLNKGVFPKLIRIALQSNDVPQYLYIISEYIISDKFEDEDIKQKLIKYKGRDIAPTDLLMLTNSMRAKKYSEYEESLTKNEFDINRSFLMLDYRCDEDIDEKIIVLLKQIKKEPEEKKYQAFEKIFNKFIGCLKQELENPKYTLKADAVNRQEEPITYDGKVILKQGDYLEIKKMDFEVDSYLSEFFSIFKESKIGYLKKEYLPMYNYFIDRVYQWINENGKEYLNIIKNNLAGIIFDNNTFVSIDQLDFYWSNKGQRNCDEKRLSIRFRIKPELKSVVGYVYEPGKGENSLTEKIIRDLPNTIREKQVCKEHLDPNFVIGESIKKNKMKILITEKQYMLLKEGISDDEELIDTIKSYEGTVKNKKGEHYVFDDKDTSKPKTFINSKDKKKGGTLTIGWGHTGTEAKIGNKISNDDAEKLLKKDIESEENKTKDIFPKYETYPTYVKRALVNSVYRGEAKSKYKWVKDVNDDNWDSASKKYLEGWNVDFSKADDPRYKGGLADRMVKNQKAFIKYAEELKDNNKTKNIIGSKVYPKKTSTTDYTNVRSGAYVNNGLINNLIGKVVSPNAIGVVEKIKKDDTGKNWYYVKLENGISLDHDYGWVRSDVVDNLK